MAQDGLALELTRGPDAPATARAAIARKMNGRLTAQRLFDLRVVVSTLVSNSIRNGAGPIEVQVRADGGAVRGTVADTGAAASSLRKSARVNGRPGLAVLDAVARDWGAQGNEVWFVV